MLSVGDGHESSEEVATVTILMRPSTLASACAPAAVAAFGARSYVAGHPAVPATIAGLERLLVPNGDMRRKAGISKINNSIQTLGKGVATSIFQDQKVSGLRVRTVDQIQGADARGIPPRGRPV
jgi:hypothetical protein